MRSRTTAPAIIQIIDREDAFALQDYQKTPRDFCITYRDMTALEYAARNGKWNFACKMLEIINGFTNDEKNNYHLYEILKIALEKKELEHITTIMDVTLNKEKRNLLKIALDKDYIIGLAEHKLWGNIKCIITEELLNNLEAEYKREHKLHTYIEKDFPKKMMQENFSFKEIMGEALFKTPCDELHGLTPEMTEGLIKKTLAKEEIDAAEKAFNAYTQKLPWMPETVANRLFSVFILAAQDDNDDAKEICDVLFSQLVKMFHGFDAKYFEKTVVRLLEKIDHGNAAHYLKRILNESIVNDDSSVLPFLPENTSRAGDVHSSYQKQISEILTILTSKLHDDFNSGKVPSIHFLNLLKDFTNQHEEALKRSGYIVLNEKSCALFESHYHQDYEKKYRNQNQKNIVTIVTTMTKILCSGSANENTISTILSTLLKTKTGITPKEYYNNQRIYQTPEEEMASRVLMQYEQNEREKKMMLAKAQEIFHQTIDDENCSEKKLRSALQGFFCNDSFLDIIKNSESCENSKPHRLAHYSSDSDYSSDLGDINDKDISHSKNSQDLKKSFIKKCVDKQYWLLLKEIVGHDNYCVDCTEETESDLNTALLLQEAVKANQIDLVKTLMAKHAALPSFKPFKETNNDGNNAFHFAILNNHEVILAVLLDNYSALTQKNIAGETPVAMAARLGKNNLLKMIAKRYPADKYPDLDYPKTEITITPPTPHLPLMSNANNPAGLLHQSVRRRRLLHSSTIHETERTLKL